MMCQSDFVLSVGLKSPKQLLQYCNDELCNPCCELSAGKELEITILVTTLLVLTLYGCLLTVNITMSLLLSV